MITKESRLKVHIRAISRIVRRKTDEVVDLADEDEP